MRLASRLLVALAMTDPHIESSCFESISLEDLGDVTGGGLWQVLAKGVRAGGVALGLLAHDAGTAGKAIGLERRAGSAITRVEEANDLARTRRPTIEGGSAPGPRPPE